MRFRALPFRVQLERVELMYEGADAPTPRRDSAVRPPARRRPLP